MRNPPQKKKKTASNGKALARGGCFERDKIHSKVLNSAVLVKIQSFFFFLFFDVLRLELRA
jgi:hypothetical protein